MLCKRLQQGNFGLLGFWAFGLLGFWAFGLLGFWAFGFLDFWIFGFLDFFLAKMFLTTVWKTCLFKPTTGNYAARPFAPPALTFECSLRSAGSWFSIGMTKPGDVKQIEGMSVLLKAILLIKKPKNHKQKNRQKSGFSLRNNDVKNVG